MTNDPDWFITGKSNWSSYICQDHPTDGNRVNTNKNYINCTKLEPPTVHLFMNEWSIGFAKMELVYVLYNFTVYKFV